MKIAREKEDGEKSMPRKRKRQEEQGEITKNGVRDGGGGAMTEVQRKKDCKEVSRRLRNRRVWVTSN